MVKRTRIIKASVDFANEIERIQNEYSERTGKIPPSRREITHLFTPLLRKNRKSLFRKMK